MEYLEVKRKQPRTARLSSIVRARGGEGSSSGWVWSIVSSDGLSPPGAWLSIRSKTTAVANWLYMVMLSLLKICWLDLWLLVCLTKGEG